MSHYFLHDMAIIMMAAAAAGVLFRRLKLPVVLGYLLAGLLVGPYTPPAGLIHDTKTIKDVAELGVVLLMFGLGLHFSLKDLAGVGAAALVAASLETLSMLALGYGIGRWLGWGNLDCVFLGGMMAISSTTIIVKSLEELGYEKLPFARTIYGMLIVEDILAIALLALLPTFASAQGLGLGAVLAIFGKLTVFMVVALLAGLLVVPKFLRAVSQLESDEMLMIAGLGVCFGFAFFASKMGYSTALGAFLGGAVVAEARERWRVEVRMQSIREMFTALFFVAVGMLLDPKMMVQYAGPIALITMGIVLGKMTLVTAGVFLTGTPARQALRVGMSMGQIGEFSFIIASLGVGLGVVRPSLYPIGVAVSTVTTLLTPFMMVGAERQAARFARLIPARLRAALRRYSASFAPEPAAAGSAAGASSGQAALVRRMLQRAGGAILLNAVLIAALFIGAKVLALHFADWGEERLPEWTGGVRALAWFMATLGALPLIVSITQRSRGLSMLLAEMWVSPAGAAIAARAGSARRARAQALVATVLQWLLLALLGLYILLMGLALLPPWPVALALAAVLALVGALRWRQYVSLYGRAQTSLAATLAEEAEPVGALGVAEAGAAAGTGASGGAGALPAALRDAVIASVSIIPGTAADGHYIRELSLRSRSGASAIALERAGKSLISPGPDQELRAGDELLLLGSPAQIERARAVLSTPVHTDAEL